MTDTAAQSYIARALASAREIANIYPRGSATGGETRAAAYVRQQLGALGIRDIRQDDFQGLRSTWLFLALAFGQALVGHAAVALLRQSLGAAFAVGMSLLFFTISAFLIWRKFTFRPYPLRDSLPHGPSQNVIGIIPSRDEARRRVVLLAHLDAHRAVWLFATDWLTRIYSLIAPLALFGIPFSAVIYLLSALPGMAPLAWAALPFALIHFLGWFTGMTADLGPYSPGANDNASAAGTLLGLAQRLKDQPLAHTEIWLAFTGCEETGCDGLLALLNAHGPELKDALFIDFELVGIGDELVYLRSEGVVRPSRVPPQVEALLARTAQHVPIHPVSAAGVSVFTEANAARERGFEAVCLMTRSSGQPALAEWHRLSDLPEKLSAQALGLAHAFAWELLQQVDAEKD